MSGSNYIAFELDSSGSVWTHSWTPNYAISMNNNSSGTLTDFINGWILGTFSSNGNDYRAWNFHTHPINAGIFVVKLSTSYSDETAHIPYVEKFARLTKNRSGLEQGYDYNASYDSPDDMFDSDSTTGMKTNHPLYADNSVIEAYGLFSVNLSLVNSNQATRNSKLLAEGVDLIASPVELTLPFENGASNTTSKVQTTSFYYNHDEGYSLDNGQSMVTPSADPTFTTGIKHNPYTNKYRYQTFGTGLTSSGFTSGKDVSTQIKTMADRKSQISGNEVELLNQILLHLGREEYDSILAKLD